MITLLFVIPVIAGFLVALHRQRSLFERIVDAAYRAAAFAYSVAQALDAALVRYRQTRRQIRYSHVPMYAEV